MADTEADCRPIVPRRLNPTACWDNHDQKPLLRAMFSNADRRRSVVRPQGVTVAITPSYFLALTFHSRPAGTR